MKRTLALLACIAVLGISAGCHGQVPVTPPVTTLPAAGNGNYTPLNAVGSSTPPTTSLNYRHAQRPSRVCRSRLPPSFGINLGAVRLLVKRRWPSHRRSYWQSAVIVDLHGGLGADL